MRLVLVVVLLLLAGCGSEGEIASRMKAVGRQIVDDWKQRPDVADARFEYSEGLAPDDYNLRLEVTLKAEAITDHVVDEIVEIAHRDCWLSPGSLYYVAYTVYSTADAPSEDRPESGTPVREGRVHLSSDLEKKYGPRPTLSR